MAGEDRRSHLSGVLDGDLGGSNITAAERGKQARSEIDVEIARRHALDAVSIVSHQPAVPDQVTAAAPSSGGGYQFDAETITKRITDWRQVLGDIRDDEAKLRAAWRAVEPPSDDTPAHKNAEDIRRSIQAAIDHNKSMQQYCQTYIDALSKANGTYVEHDQDVSRGLSGAESATDGSAL